MAGNQLPFRLDEARCFQVTQPTHDSRLAASECFIHGCQSHTFGWNSLERHFEFRRSSSKDPRSINHDAPSHIFQRFENKTDTEELKLSGFFSSNTRKMVSNDDLITMAVGAGAWTIAVPAVQLAGRSVASEPSDKYATKAIACVVGVGIAYVTTPLVSYIRGWKTPNEKVRGIALALGTAQVIDGLVHLFYPTFYDSNHQTGVACAGNIFLGAGLLGIFSANQ